MLNQNEHDQNGDQLVEPFQVRKSKPEEVVGAPGSKRPLGESDETSRNRLVESGLLAGLRRSLEPDSVDSAEAEAKNVADQIGPRVGKAENEEGSRGDLAALVQVPEGKGRSSEEEVHLANIEALLSQIDKMNLSAKESEILNEMEDLLARLQEIPDDEEVVGKAILDFTSLMSNAVEGSRALETMSRGLGLKFKSSESYKLTKDERKMVNTARNLEKALGVRSLAKGLEHAIRQIHRNGDQLTLLVKSLDGSGPDVDVGRALNDPKLKSLLADNAPILERNVDWVHSGSRAIADALFGNRP